MYVYVFMCVHVVEWGWTTTIVQTCIHAYMYVHKYMYMRGNGGRTSIILCIRDTHVHHIYICTCIHTY